MCSASMVCMPMTNVWARAANTRSVVAARPDVASRRAKCHTYTMRAATYPTSGTKFIVLGRCAWREVALLGARDGVLAAAADNEAPPGAVAPRIARGVAERVLARQFVGDLTVNTV